MTAVNDLLLFFLGFGWGFATCAIWINSRDRAREREEWERLGKPNVPWRVADRVPERVPKAPAYYTDEFLRDWHRKHGANVNPPPPPGARPIPSPPPPPPHRSVGGAQ